MSITRNIASAEELLASIPEKFCLTEEDKTKLVAAHIRTLSLLNDFTPRDGEGVDVVVNLTVFEDTGGHQLIAEGTVVDNSRSSRPAAFNWHLQDTSRWLLGCGLVFDKGRHEFSLHT